MMKKEYSLLTLLLVAFNYLTFAQQVKKVQFVGAARSVVGTNTIDVKDATPDTITAKKNSGGYAQIDLGVNIFPNTNTEILGMIRIRNAFGGFFGGGVTFDVRQLYLKGVIANVVRYQLGDINYKLTPYTFYSNDNEFGLETPYPFKIQNEIIQYENFMHKNTWRQQGGAEDFGLEFAKIIQEINFKTFITRINATNFLTAPERYFGGGNIGLVQSKNFYLGGNFVSLFDLGGTIPDSNVYRNNVYSGIIAYTYENERMEAKAEGEAGRSAAFYRQDSLAPKLEDSFLDAGVSFRYKPANTKIKIGYMDIGPDFRSAGAQSKRVDYNLSPALYQRYTNQQLLRESSMFDLMRDETIYQKSISSKLMPYHPSYNNVMPYGVATFNRKGMYAQLSFSDKKKVFSVTADAYFLNEIRGQGTRKLKSFSRYTAQTEINLHTLIGFKNAIKVMGGVSEQMTSRLSDVEFEKINLTSTVFNAGIEIEAIKDFDIQFGIQSFSSNGNDLTPERDIYSEVKNFNEYKVDFAESIIGAGLQYRFSENVRIAFTYTTYTFDDKIIPNSSYGINQFFVTYNMKF